MSAGRQSAAGAPVRELIFYRNHSGGPRSEARGAKPAWQAFLETQQSLHPPYGIVMQADHAKLSGALARILDPDAFGALPEDVIEAIARHDSGWRTSDEDQVKAIALAPPRPFPKLPPEQTVPYWQESVRRAEEWSPLTGIVVSRHFCALGGMDPAHRPFLDWAVPRRERLEQIVAAAPADLERWTAAIGFCDILSLYLCSGTRAPAEFALAHPALPAARNARKVFLDWDGAKPRFSSPVVWPGEIVSVDVRRRAGEKPELQRDTVCWSFAE